MPYYLVTLVNEQGEVLDTYSVESDEPFTMSVTPNPGWLGTAI